MKDNWISDDSDKMRKADEAPGFFDWRQNKNDFVRNDENIDGIFNVVAKLDLVYDTNGYNCAWDIVRVVRRYQKEVR
jgi:hypothetical protein